ASTQQEVAGLARIDRASAGAARPEPAFPGERVAREQHLVTARAGSVDELGARGHVAGLRGRARVQEGGPHLEYGLALEATRVLPAAAVTRLAANPDLQEVRGVEAGTHRLQGLRKQRALVPALGLFAQEADLVGQCAREPGPIVHLEGEAALG